ncbi:hypothetical protein [Chitinimonas arctica]|nr:hypothetical protein [Chitinimonas arctica]
MLKRLHVAEDQVAFPYPAVLGYRRLMAGVKEMLHPHGPRPDVGVRFKNGSVKVIEGASKTENPARLASRNLDKMHLEKMTDASVKVNNWAVWINRIFGN